MVTVSGLYVALASAYWFIWRMKTWIEWRRGLCGEREDVIRGQAEVIGLLEETIRVLLEEKCG
jgi:hypothetical protein